MVWSYIAFSTSVIGTFIKVSWRNARDTGMKRKRENIVSRHTIDLSHSNIHWAKVKLLLRSERSKRAAT